jgi:aminoglycoside phosphotransferase
MASSSFIVDRWSSRPGEKYNNMYVYAHTKKEKKKKKTRPMQAHTIVYEEGKEKEKMFFFSALRAVVHLEKAISEPAITIQKEKERTRNLACTRIKRGKKRI